MPIHQLMHDVACLLCCCLLLCCGQASSAYKHSLKEVLALPAIAGKIKDTKAAREVAALQVRGPHTLKPAATAWCHLTYAAWSTLLPIIRRPRLGRITTRSQHAGSPGRLAQQDARAARCMPEAPRQ
eukprot:GHRQ01035865.1.p4 GENE.GHRQ01035865.1~~GHRQ01035865.1.p4  ORF type:complete len:127 (-),score=13.02 GHRQ01035865.1:1243-1623(-)